MGATAEVRRLSGTAIEGHTKGVKADRLSDEALDLAIKERQIDVGADASRDQRAAAIFTYMMEGDAAKKWECILCKLCDGSSDESLSYCPYCGDGLEDDDDVDDSGGFAPEALTVRATPSALSGGGLITKVRETIPQSQAMAIPKPQTMAIVKPKAPGGLAKFTIKDLDQAANVVAGLKGHVGTAWWEIGQAISKIYANNVWRLRMKSDGRTRAYNTWEVACLAEFDLPHQSALNAMDTFRRYPKEYAAKYGVSKMTVLVRLHDDATRQEIQRLMESGSTVKELKAVAKEKTEEKREKGEPITRRQQLPSGEIVHRPMKLPQKRPDGSTTRKPKTVPGATITVAAIEHTKGESKMWMLPSGADISKTLSDVATLKRAKTLDDDPVAVIPLKNAANIYIRLVERDDGIEVLWTVGREP
jgi:hypothetical protein